VFDPVRLAPSAGDQGVLTGMPPEVVSEMLRGVVGRPGALELERLVIDDEGAAGPFTVGRADGAQVDAVRTAVAGMRAAVAGLAGELVGLDDLDDPGLAWVWSRVDDVDA